MPYTEQIESTKKKLADTKLTIKALQEKKLSVTDAEELKAINKQINALQEELGRLREEMKNTRAFLKDIEREYVCCVAGEE